MARNRKPRPVRNTLTKDELGNREWVDPSTLQEVISFYGEISGLRILKPPKDPGYKHPDYWFELLSEDDGHWFPGRTLASAYWLEDLLNVVTEAAAWVKDHPHKEDEDERTTKSDLCGL